MKKPELLAPGGNLERLMAAIDYGADAVYIGGEAFGLRVASENFSLSDMKKGIEYAHSRGKKVYLTANIIPHNRDIDEFEKYIEEIRPLGIDACLVSDPGMFDVLKKNAPEIPIHISTQANNTNYRSAEFWYNMGAERVVLAREMSFEEIAEIRRRIPKELEIEAFIHGAMCISYSGRCLLSNYMTGRDANMGACAHPCRWEYSLVEKTRPGEYMDIEENERGSFIFNSKDLCMIEHIPELIKSGISSLKIEGRVKTSYYVATVVAAYRREIDKYFADPDNYTFDGEGAKELSKVSHRPYTTGFYFGRPGDEAQVYTDSSYIREYDLCGMVMGYDKDTGLALVSQRNKFFAGDEVEIMQPGQPFFSQKVTRLINEAGEEIESVPHAAMMFKMPVDRPIQKGAMIRIKRK